MLSCLLFLNILLTDKQINGLELISSVEFAFYCSYLTVKSKELSLRKRESTQTGVTKSTIWIFKGSGIPEGPEDHGKQLWLMTRIPFLVNNTPLITAG